MFIFERERGRGRGREREREREREKGYRGPEAGSVLTAESPMWGLNSNREIMTPAEVGCLAD